MNIDPDNYTDAELFDLLGLLNPKNWTIIFLKNRIIAKSFMIPIINGIWFTVCFSLPFGGIQVIFCGDFFQLPPVGSLTEVETGNFCFEFQEQSDCCQYM